MDVLTARFLATPQDSPMPYAGLLDKVRMQALASNSGGKRLRALLALDAYDAAADSLGHGQSASAPSAATPPATHNREAMLDLACALEIYQTSALIHDDIIDDSDLRRGAPSAHKALEFGGDERLGGGLALMLGNLLATASVRIADAALAQLHSPGTGAQVFLDMQRAVSIGQVLDLSAETIPLDDPQRLAQASLEVFRWKTASYTAIAPLELGFLAAGLDPAGAHESALQIGEPLGISFQLADDLIDVDANGHSSGKPLGGDIREGKHTVLLADALQRADAQQRERLLAIYGASTRSGSDVAEVIRLFASTGAVAQSRRRISALLRKSSAAIEKNTLLSRAAKTLVRSACARMMPAYDA
jgi:geranylgeranyl diphosphate synthase type I